jgi:TolB-like protein/tetratricopeptide (TPR) repeat protein
MSTLATRIDSEEMIRQLERVEASATFQQVDRLKRFLSFVVFETAAGRGNQLKEYVIGVQVFDEDTSFDPRTDPIVRVQARRLRARLAKYYAEEGQQDLLLIELPKGGYAPIFKRVESPQPKRSLTRALANRNTVAVLPFSDQSPAGDMEYFCQGLSQEIIHALTAGETVRVLAAGSTGSSSALPAADPREIASALDVAILVSGSVRKHGPLVRVTVQMIHGASGSYAWSQTLDGRVEEGFVLQEQVAAAVLARLRDAVRPGAARSFSRTVENLAARNLCLQGRFHMNQRTEEGLRKALDLFEKALIEDRQYAEAFSGLADTYGLLGHYGVLSPAEVWTKAASSAASAVMVNEHSADTHVSLAHVKSTQDWDWHGAEQEFLRAIALDPRHSTAHHWYGISCLAPMARLDEALEELLVAQSLDPVSSIIARDLAIIHLYRRDFEAALEQIDHTVELNPHFSPAYWALGVIQEQRGESDESVAAFQRAIQLSPDSPRMHGALGRTLALAGKRERALGILGELTELAARRYVSPFELASINFALGDNDRGFAWLGKAFQDRSFELLSILVDPRFDSIRKDARFVGLAGQLGLG